MDTDNVSDDEYYTDLIELFSVPGWKRLIREAYAQVVQNQADAIDAPSWDRVCELRGENAQLSRLINLEPMVRAMQAQATGIEAE